MFECNLSAQVYIFFLCSFKISAFKLRMDFPVKQETLCVQQLIFIHHGILKDGLRFCVTISDTTFRIFMYAYIHVRGRDLEQHHTSLLIFICFHGSESIQWSVVTTSGSQTVTLHKWDHKYNNNNNENNNNNMQDRKYTDGSRFFLLVSQRHTFSSPLSSWGDGIFGLVRLNKLTDC